MNKRQGYLIHQLRFTAIHDNNLYCTIRVPYCAIRVPYCTTQVSYYTIRVPYDSVTLPILPRWSRVQSCDLWQIRLKCAAFKICFLVSFLFKLVIEEWCCSNVSHAAEDGHMISHIPAKHKHSVWDTQYGERELSCLCGASIAAICLLHTGFQVYVLSSAHCPSLPPRQPSYYLCTIELQWTVLGFLCQLEMGWKPCWRFGPECSDLFQDELRQDFQPISSWYRRTLYCSCNSQIRGPRFTEPSMLCLECETRMNRLSGHTGNTKG